jgi:parvulin-like peptidyl-prolyl isomerase
MRLNHDPNDTQARVLLWAGVISGLLLTAISLMRSREPTGDANATVPVGSVALVNGYPIAAELYARILGGLAAERRTVGAEQADRQRILDRLIDEELLVQRGIELGLARADQVIRRQIVNVLTSSLATETEELTPEDGELRRFYAEHSDLFARTDRLSFAQIFLRVPSALQDDEQRQRAEQVVTRLRVGQLFEAVNKEFGDDPVLRLPTGPLPPEKIQEYLGPTVMQALMLLNPGEVSDPVRSGTGYHVLVLHERQLGTVPPFESLRDVILTQYRRVAGEQVVAAYIADLRKQARIQTAKEWKTIEGERVLQAED